MTPPLRRLLFPTDFSACAEGAYRHAAWLAARFGAELHVLHVAGGEAPAREWPETAGLGHLHLSMADVAADLRLPPPEAGAPSDDVEVVETEVAGLSVPEAVLDYARAEEVDLVVMGTHGRRGWRRGLLGSAAEAVMRRAPCPVLAVRPLDRTASAPWPPAHVLLALDAVPTPGAPLPAHAAWAADLAVAYGATLEVVHVAPPPDALRVRERLLAALEATADRLRDGRPEAQAVTATLGSGDPVEAVRALAEARSAHLVVAGTHSRGGAVRVLAGSVAEELARTAPCPVLVVRDALGAATAGASSAVGRRAL